MTDAGITCRRSRRRPARLLTVALLAAAALAACGHIEVTPRKPGVEADHVTSGDINQ